MIVLPAFGGDSGLKLVAVIGAGLSAALVAQQLTQKQIPFVVYEQYSRDDLPQKKSDGFNDFQKFYRFVELDSDRKHRVYDAPFFCGKSAFWGGWVNHIADENLKSSQEAVSDFLNVTEVSNVSVQLRQPIEDCQLRWFPKRMATNSQGRVLRSFDLIDQEQVRFGFELKKINVENKKVSNLLFYNKVENKEEVIACDHVILCTSPFETLKILKTSFYSEQDFVVPFQDHLHVNYMMVVKNPELKNQEASSIVIDRFVNLDSHNQRSYPGGFVCEWNGPHSVFELEEETRRVLKIPDDEDYSYYTFHGLGECDPNEKQITIKEDLSLKFEWKNTNQDLAMIKDMQKTGQVIFAKLKETEKRILEISKPEKISGCGHESSMLTNHSFGASSLAKGLFLANASIMPSVTDRHPTATLLSHIHQNMQSWDLA